MNKDRTRDRDVSKDLGTSSDRAMYSPSEARGRGSDSTRNEGEGGDRQGGQRDRASGHQQDSGNSGGISNRALDSERQEQEELPPRGSGKDAGRTQGGGSGGHSPSRDVQDQTQIRNNSRVRDE